MQKQTNLFQTIYSMKVKTNIYWIFGALLMLTSCYTNNVVTKYDYSYLYDDNQSIINPKFKIFHHSADSSSLFYEISSQDILYERIQSDSSMIARLKMKYTLYANRELTIVLDSGKADMSNFGSNGKTNLLQNEIRFKTSKREKTWISVRFRDDNKDFNILNTIEVDKGKNNNNQYFLLLDGEQVLMNGIAKNQVVTIQKSPLITENNFTMELNKRSFSMTPPPFAQQLNNELNIKVDSSFDFTFFNNNFTTGNSFPLQRFRSQSDSLKGWNYYSYFGSNFPSLSNINELIDPTRYISTSREYKNLKAAVNPKKGLDVFWLKLGKREENSKELLKEYYQRIEIANKYFTSFKEGWKTDRGIIYIIYGAPSTIRKNVDKEVWLYGEENNVLSVQFRFYQVENSNINNHYNMVRNSDYKNNWYRQVDIWRQGKID